MAGITFWRTVAGAGRRQRNGWPAALRNALLSVATLRNALLSVAALLPLVTHGASAGRDTAVADDAQLAGLAERVLESLPVPARDTAARIPDPGRRLLAVRAYLRAGDALSARWSWNQDEAKAFARSSEGRSLQQAVAAVRCAFERANPGHTLYVNPEFRSLEVQLARWNANDSVGRAARNLLVQARVALRRESPGAGAAQASWLRELLLRHAPQPVPTLAAPGLSPHGRASAVDFQVHREGRLVAGPDSASVSRVWDKGGWSLRLAAAVAESRAPFEGPLRSPDEPWHYSYVPRADAAPLATCAG